MSRRRVLWGVFIGLLVLMVSGCVDVFQGSPVFKSITVEPAKIKTNETASSQKTFKVVVELEVNTDNVDLTRSEVSIRNPQTGEQRKALVPADGMSIEGSKVIFDKISMAWVQGFPSGRYNVSAKIAMDRGEYTYNEASQGVLEIEE